MYPRGRAFEARASMAKKIHIDQLRSIILDIDTGRNDVSSLDLRLRGASAGLRLHTADAVVVDGSGSLDLTQGGTIRMGATAPDTKLRISLPYSLEHSLPDISVRVEATYKTAAGTSVFSNTCQIRVELPLDVDVHDIFKSRTLFSRFNIRTTTSVPLQVMSVHLQGSVVYNVQALPCPPEMTVFEKQPASLTYKITKKPMQAPSPGVSKKDAALAMTIKYLCTDQLILNAMTSRLKQALQQSPYARLTRLLVPLLRDGAQSHALALQLEHAVLMQELTLPAYETIGWESAISRLAVSTREGLTKWLKEWHQVLCPLLTPQALHLAPPKLI